MGKKKTAHSDAAVKRNPNQPAVVSEVPGQTGTPATSSRLLTLGFVSNSGETSGTCSDARGRPPKRDVCPAVACAGCNLVAVTVCWLSVYT